MTDLSPQAHEILKAAYKATRNPQWQTNFYSSYAAAVLRTAADQVAPACSALSESGTKQLLIRHELLTIAAELEGKLMTDFRALCAELVEKLDELNCNFNVPNQSALIERSCAALAQPEPQGPKLVYRYNPATIAECGGPCKQGPQYCDCGQIKGEPEPQGVTNYNEDFWRKDALEKLVYAAMSFRLGIYGAEELEIFENRARFFLARWGRPAIEPVTKSEAHNG